MPVPEAGQRWRRLGALWCAVVVGSPSAGSSVRGRQSSPVTGSLAVRGHGATRALWSLGRHGEDWALKFWVWREQGERVGHSEACRVGGSQQVEELPRSLPAFAGVKSAGAESLKM